MWLCKKEFFVKLDLLLGPQAIVPLIFVNRKNEGSKRQCRKAVAQNFSNLPSLTKLTAESLPQSQPRLPSEPSPQSKSFIVQFDADASASRETISATRGLSDNCKH